MLLLQLQPRGSKTGRPVLEREAWTEQKILENDHVCVYILLVALFFQILHANKLSDDIKDKCFILPQNLTGYGAQGGRNRKMSLRRRCL